MKKMTCVLAVGLFATSATSAWAQRAEQRGEQNEMSFFVTSVGTGKGANLGGIRGADAHCQSLAQAVGGSAAAKTWHAYLSVTDLNGKGAINARDRIGPGPWYNAKGVRIARDVEDLHSESSNITAATTLTEKGAKLGSEPNVHDMLTGSMRDGTAWNYNLLDDLNLEKGAMTCDNYTSDAEEGAVMVGHADRAGTAPLSPWNAAHPSVGCSQAKLVSTGGAGLFYCFAID
jgi:hypothetical protein